MSQSNDGTEFKPSGATTGPAAPAPPERWSIREDLPEYDVVDEENNHLAFTSTVQAEAIAVRDALNAVARGSAHRGAPEPSGEFHDAKFPWASSALLAYGRAEWACGKRHTREDHPEGRCPDVDAALGAVGGIEPAQERALLRRWLHSVAPRAVEGRAETFDALIADTKSLLEGVEPAPECAHVEVKSIMGSGPDDYGNGYCVACYEQMRWKDGAWHVNK